MKQFYSFDVIVKDDGKLKRRTASGSFELYDEAPIEKTYTCRVDTKGILLQSLCV